jgi:type IX secretion system PorP/SprF family membrane protein
MLRKTLYIVLLFLFFVRLYGQQDPHYTQYMYNMSVMNPAYATDDPETVQLGALYRAQWVGVTGAPTTGMFFAHSPIGKNVELGVSILHDQIGDVVKETAAFVDFAYVLRFSGEHRLSFGVKAGASFFDTNFNGFQYSSAIPDPAFAENLSRMFPNIGTGIFYFTDRYYLGLSAPNMLRNTHLTRQDGIVANGIESTHYFLTGGYVFQVTDQLKVKPAFMAKAVAGAPLSLDFTTNVLIQETVEIGVAYRAGDAVSGLVNIRLNPSLRIGYAYDYTLTNLSRFNSGSHEILLLFDLFKEQRRKGFDRSPRFF